MRRLSLLLPLLALPGEAAAYIDPGTGSLIIQGLIAAFAASAVVVRGYWYRIKGLFRRRPAAEPSPAAEKTRPPGAGE